MSFLESIQSIGGVVAGIFQNTEETVNRFFGRFERRMIRHGYAMKRFVTIAVVEIFILIFGLLCFLTGLIVLLARVAPMDIVLIVAGIILMNIVLLTAKFK